MAYEIWRKAVDNYHNKGVGDSVRYPAKDGRIINAVVKSHNPNTLKTEIELEEPITVGGR